MEIKSYLTSLGIKFKTFSHPPVYTCEEAKRYSNKIKGIHSKNLFLKDKKGENFYLVIIPEYKKLQIKDLEKNLGQKLTFADEKDLKSLLNLTSGAVSPFGLINDKELKTKLIIDKKILDSEFKSFHPNVNTETLELTKENFGKYLNSIKNKITII